MDDSRGTYVQAHNITAGNFVVGEEVVIHGGLSGQIPAEPEALLRGIAEQIERHRASLPLADDLLADVDQIARDLADDNAADSGHRLRLRARIDRLAAGVGSVATLAATVHELVSALGI
jgi:hypothetical protein